MAQYTTAQIQAMIAAEAQRQGLDPNLALQVAAHESSFNPAAVSSTGAEGLFQLEPATAADLGVSDPFDPMQNIAGGVRYLKQMLDRYNGDLTMALEAYNGGMRHVDQGTVSSAAQHYAQFILAKLGLADSPGPPAGGWPGVEPPDKVPTVDAGGNLMFDAGLVPFGLSLPSSLADVPAPMLIAGAVVGAYLVWDLLFGNG